VQEVQMVQVVPEVLVQVVPEVLVQVVPGCWC